MGRRREKEGEGGGRGKDGEGEKGRGRKERIDQNRCGSCKNATHKRAAGWPGLAVITYDATLPSGHVCPFQYPKAYRRQSRQSPFSHMEVTRPLRSVNDTNCPLVGF